MNIDPKIKTRLTQYEDWVLLGEGSLGQTWRARNALTGAQVVIKTRPLTDAARRAVTREADLMRGLHHEGLQRFVELVAVEDTLLLVYAYVDGVSLAEQLEQHGPYTADAALDIIAGLLEAVQVIHDAGFIHRDISPHNVILQPGNQPVLIDFNALGHLTESSTLGMSTVVGEFAGKVLYMAPEQLAAASQTTAVDIWAIGALMFELVTGRPYQQGRTIVEIVRHSVDADEPQVSDAPQVLQPFLIKCLDQDAGRRPDAREARALIDALRAPVPSAPQPPQPASQPNMQEFDALLQRDFGTAPKSAPPTVGAKKRATSSLVWWVLTGVVAILGAAGFFWLGMLGGPELPTMDPPGDPGPAPLPSTWDSLLTTDPRSLAIVVFGLCLIALGFAVARYLRRRASELRVALPFEAMQLISGPDAQKRLSETICVQIDAYRVAAGHAADRMLTLTMVALAKEYKDAETHDQRLAALKMLHELHGKVAARLQPWWLDYETLVARGISLASLAGGALVVFEGVQRLL